MRYIINIMILLTLSGCAVVDDYMLGKDNQPQPKVLAQYQGKQQLKPVWKSTVPGFSNKQLKGGDIKSAMVGQTIFSANGAGVIQAQNKQTGKVLWQAKLSSEISAGIAANAKYVVVGTGQAQLVIIDAVTGKQRQSLPLSNLMLASPVLLDNVLVTKTIDGKVTRYNLATSKVQWQYAHSASDFIFRGDSSPTIYGNAIYAGFSDGKLAAINFDNGQLIWQRQVAYPRGASQIDRMVDIMSKPLVQKEVVYVASYHGAVVALKRKSGQELWHSKISTMKDIALGNNALYIVDDSSEVWALDKYSGRIVWHQNKLQYRGLSAPVVFAKGIAVSDKQGYFHLLSPITGALIGREPIGQAGLTGQLLVDGTDLYLNYINGAVSHYQMVS